MSTIPSIVSQSKAAGSPLTRTELARFLPTKRAIDVFNALTVDVPTVIDQSNLLAQEVDSFSFNFDALNADVLALQAEDVFLQSQIDGIEVSTPGAITGLTDGLVFDNSPLIQGAVGPAELSGTIVAADGVVSSVPISATGLLVKSTITADPQVSMYWNARGGTVLVPDARLPGIVPGTPGTATRIGGGGPGSVIRSARRAPGLNKQAYQQILGGFCIDATGVNASKSFTCNTSGVFTSNAHGRLNGDIIFFDSDSIGTLLPTPLVNGNDSAIAHSYQVTNATTNTFKVNAYDAGTKTWPTAVTTTTAGNGVWSTNVCGIRVPNQKPTENLNDGDQDYDDNKQYTAGLIRDIDISGMSGHGFICEDNNGRLHIDSARAMNCRLNGWHILSQDKVLSGHWAAGSNGKFGLYADTGTGVYAVTGNIWGNPGKRSFDCGAIWFDDVMYWALVANQPNDWIRLDGKGHFNASGAFVGNMFHPHGENFTSDGIAINVYNDGDQRMQSHIVARGYQGLVFAGNAWARTEGVKSRFNTPGNFGGSKDGTNGTAIQQLYYFDVLNGNPAGATIIEGYYTGPDVKPWQGPQSTVTMTLANPCVVTWNAHPFVVGDRIFFTTTGTLPSHVSTDPTAYYVTSTTTNTFQFSATAGGTPVDTSADSQSGTHTCWHISSSPYSVNGSSRIAGVYVDSYRGSVRLWSVNGAAAKFMIGNSYKNQPWEGNPNYLCEFGTTDLTASLPTRSVLYGQWEHDSAWGYTDAAFNAKQLTTSGHTITARTAVQFYTVAAGATIANATITLPTDLTHTRPLDIIFSSGGCTALSWTVAGGGSINTNTVPLPSTWLGAMYVRLMFRRDNNTWFVQSVSGAADPYVTLTIAVGAIATDCSKGKNFRVSQTGNATLSNPSNPQDGVIYTWELTQDATGGRTITWGSNFRKAAGDTFTTTANTVTVIQAKYSAADTKFDVVTFRTGLT